MFRINGLPARAPWQVHTRVLDRDRLRKTRWQYGPLTTPWDRPTPSGPYRGRF